MTTNIENQVTANPFLSEQIFPHLIKLTDPLDAIVLAADGFAVLEYVVTCARAQEAGSPTPAFPEFQSMFLRDLSAAAGNWLERCLRFAAKDWKRAEAELGKLRAGRMLSTDDTWTDAEVREFFAAVTRAAQSKVVH